MPDECYNQNTMVIGWVNNEYRNTGTTFEAIVNGVNLPFKQCASELKITSNIKTYVCISTCISKDYSNRTMQLVVVLPLRF